MEQKDFLIEEGILSPKKEVEYRAAIASRDNEISSLKEENADLRRQLAFFKKAVYGQKSEKTEYVLENSEQISITDLGVFNEVEEATDLRSVGENRKAREAEKPIVIAEHTRKPKRTHEELAENLESEDVLHEVPVEVRKCRKCGSDMKPAGREFVRDELIYVPARLFVRKHYAEVLKCPDCGCNDGNDASLTDIEKALFRKAPVPAPMIPHSYASPSLLSQIAYDKYCNAMPLYRQEQNYARLGVPLSRTTMANWIMYAAENWLTHLRGLMKSELLLQSVIHADETVVQVNREPGKKPSSESRMWVYCSGKPGTPDNILFEYRPSRSGDWPKKFLDGFCGCLVTDGYEGYSRVDAGKVTRCACWAHVRRKWVEALPDKQEQLAGSKAAAGVEYCNELFRLEKEFAGLGAEERQRQRLEKTKPVLDAFYVWIDTFRAAGGTALSKAVAYTVNCRKPLFAFLGNPDVPISNNRAENAIRPFVIGRKNWLFSDTPRGAEASAIFYSLAATACANGLDPRKYFEYLFTHLPALLSGNLCRGQVPDAQMLRSFLPWDAQIKIKCM